MDFENIVKSLKNRENSTSKKINREIQKILEKKTAESSTENEVDFL